MKKILVLIVCLFSFSLISQEYNEKPLKYKNIKNDDNKFFLPNIMEIELPDSLLKQLKHSKYFKVDVKKMAEELNKLEMNSYTTIDSVVKVK